MAAINDDNNEVNNPQEKIGQLKKEKQYQKRASVVVAAEDSGASSPCLLALDASFSGLPTPNASSLDLSTPGAAISSPGTTSPDLSNPKYGLPNLTTTTSLSSPLFRSFPLSIFRCSESGGVYHQDLNNYVRHTTPTSSFTMLVFRSILILLGEDYAV